MSIAKAKLVLNVLLNVRGYISWRKTNRSNNYKVHFDRIQEDGENIRKAKMFGSYAMATQPSAVEEWNDLPKAEPDEAAPRPNQKMSTADDFFNDLKPNNQGKQYE